MFDGVAGTRRRPEGYGDAFEAADAIRRLFDFDPRLGATGFGTLMVAYSIMQSRLIMDANMTDDGCRQMIAKLVESSNTLIEKFIDIRNTKTRGS